MFLVHFTITVFLLRSNTQEPEKGTIYRAMYYYFYCLQIWSVLLFISSPHIGSSVQSIYEVGINKGQNLLPPSVERSVRSGRGDLKLNVEWWNEACILLYILRFVWFRSGVVVMQ